MQIILASSNPDKFKQLSIYFNDLGLSLVRADKKIGVDENMPTLRENAEKKALTYSSLYPGQFVLATDGGIRIPYLGKDWNHVLTRRLSGRDMQDGFNDMERCKILLDMMKDARGDDRKVSWHEAYSIVRDGNIVFSEELSGVDDSGILLDYIPPDFKETGFWIGYLWYEKKFKKHYMALTDKEKKSIKGATSEFIRLIKEKKIFSDRTTN